MNMTATALTDIALTTLDGRPTTLAELADGAALVVNVASRCGLTPQYTALEQLAKDYGERGLTVIGVHCAGFPPSQDPDAVAAAVARLEISHPVVVDAELEIWRLYGNVGWPARYLFNEHGMLFERHFGEGAYDETERAIQELLGMEEPLVETIRPEDAPGALLEAQSEDVPGPYSGAYRAGGVWAVLDGHGTVTTNGREIAVSGPGCYELVSHPRSTEGTLALELGQSVVCHAVCFTPGLA